MIIWRGWGLVVFGIAFGCCLVAQLFCQNIAGTSTYWESHAWPLATALASAGAFCWITAKLLDRRKGRVLVDPATGARFEFKNQDALFFIPVKYWGAILLVSAAFVLVTNKTPGPSKANASARTASVHNQ